MRKQTEKKQIVEKVNFFEVCTECTENKRPEKAQGHLFFLKGREDLAPPTSTQRYWLQWREKITRIMMWFPEWVAFIDVMPSIAYRGRDVFRSTLALLLSLVQRIKSSVTGYLPTIEWLMAASKLVVFHLLHHTVWQYNTDKLTFQNQYWFNQKLHHTTVTLLLFWCCNVNLHLFNQPHLTSAGDARLAAFIIAAQYSLSSSSTD